MDEMKYDKILYPDALHLEHPTRNFSLRSQENPKVNYIWVIFTLLYILL